MRETHSVHSPTPTTPPPPTPTPCRCESVTPWSLLSHLDLAAAVSPWLLVATVGETHARPTCCCRRRRLLDLPSPASLLQPSQFTGIYFSLFLQISKPNKMFVTLWSENLRFIESRNCACVVPCELTENLTLCCCLWWIFLFFLFCLSFWLCDSVFVTLSLVYIDKRDRKRETESRVCKD